MSTLTERACRPRLCRDRRGQKARRVVRTLARGIVALAVAFALCGSASAAEIHGAARVGDLEKVKELLAADPGLANARDDGGSTPLHWAARGVHAELAKFLMQHGADVTIRNANQVIALHSVAYRGADELVALMVSSGADIDAKAVTGATPLHFAVQGGHAQTTELLLSRGAAVDATDGLGSTPLLLAASFGLKEMVGVMP